MKFRIEHARKFQKMENVILGLQRKNVPLHVKLVSVVIYLIWRTDIENLNQIHFYLFYIILQNFSQVTEMMKPQLLRLQLRQQQRLVVSYHNYNEKYLLFTKTTLFILSIQMKLKNRQKSRLNQPSVMMQTWVDVSVGIQPTGLLPTHFGWVMYNGALRFIARLVGNPRNYPLCQPCDAMGKTS